ncbi:hypothetical protein HDV05_002633, partial [Chytridiales sp. JEL 0842]
PLSVAAIIGLCSQKYPYIGEPENPNLEFELIPYEFFQCLYDCAVLKSQSTIQKAELSAGDAVDDQSQRASLPSASSKEVQDESLQSSLVNEDSTKTEQIAGIVEESAPECVPVNTEPILAPAGEETLEQATKVESSSFTDITSNQNDQSTVNPEDSSVVLLNDTTAD